MTGPPGAAVVVDGPHAVVSRWLDDNHKRNPKPYAVSPPRGGAAQTVIEVRLLDDALAARLGVRAQRGTAVFLDPHRFRVAAGPHLVEATRWEDLTAWSGARAWTVRFVTPTTVRSGDRSSPWLAPESVLRGLADRWRVLHPPTGPVATVRHGASVWVSDVDGHSEALTVGKRVVSGFVGAIRYVCDGADEDARRVEALLRFARYAGVGSHTAFGLGVAVLEQTWQPRLSGGRAEPRAITTSGHRAAG